MKDKQLQRLLIIMLVLSLIAALLLYSDIR